MSLEAKTNSNRRQMRVIVPYPKSSLGGIETLTHSVIQELANLVDTVVWVLPDELVNLTQLVPQTPALLIRSASWPTGTWQEHLSSVAGRLLALKHSGPTVLRHALRRLRLQLRLEHLIRQHRITHCLFTWIPWGQPIPRLSVPIVAIVHDTNWRTYPGNFPTYAPDYLNAITQEWVSAAKTIITPSRSVQREVSELCPEYAFKLRVVPEAATACKQDSSASAEDRRADDACPIFYYPATAGAHKAHIALFRATLRLASAGHRFRVVLTGDRTSMLTDQHASPIRHIEECRTFYQQNRGVLQQYIEARDFCEPDQVEELYRRSKRVVLPSKYEGFGLPLIEAVSRGCRVICSDIEPFREQIDLFNCGNFVQVYPVDDLSALAFHMEQALLTPNEERLSDSEAQSISSRWTWTDATRAILSILEESGGKCLTVR